MSDRLQVATSPYLQLHAADPIDWYPWGPEAFEMARRLDRPVLISIGYLACHWCHVMHRESFTEPRIAELINDQFVPVKVDREQRPDVDHVYMTACGLIAGHGGWPLTVITTPDGQPFFAGTYFPPYSRRQSPGLYEILAAVSAQWRKDRQECVDRARAVTAHLHLAMTESAPGDISPALLDAAADALRRDIDPDWGGFGRPPKFPLPAHLMLCLRLGSLYGTARLAERTLAGMYRGGIYDHVGDGFCRYAVDRRWRLPHFEKMLYDNALLSQVAASAFRRSGQELCGRVAQHTLEFLRRELRDDSGGFFSALGADADGIEGGHYLLRRTDVAEIAPRGPAERWCELYGLPADPDLPGVPNLLRIPIDDPMLLSGQIPNPGDNELELVRRRLLARRNSIPRPLLDDKILPGWNGLAISAFAQAALAFGDEEYLAVGQQAADFLHRTLYRDGRLAGTYHRGRTDGHGLLGDYAHVGLGLLDLYAADHATRWLEWALELAETLATGFCSQGRLYSSPFDQLLPVRCREVHDGTMPSDNSAAVGFVLRLGRLVGDDKFVDLARGVVADLAGGIGREPLAFCHLLLSVDELCRAPVSVIIAGPAGDSRTRRLLKAASSSSSPARYVLYQDPTGRPCPATARLPASDQPVAYVSNNGAQIGPIADPDELTAALIDSR